MGFHIAYECRTAANGNDLVATAVDFVMNMHAVVTGNYRDLAMVKSNQWNISMRRAQPCIGTQNASGGAIVFGEFVRTQFTTASGAGRMP